MARLFNGTSDAAQAASVDLSAVNKLTLSFWLWWDAFADNDDMAMEFTADTNANQGFFVDPNSGFPSAGQFQCAFKCGGASVNSGYFTRPSAAAWHHYAILFDASVNPDTIAAYVDGVSQTITYNAQFNTTGTFDNATLNFMSRNAASLFGAGRMAEVALYPGVLLTADEITALAKRFSPLLIRPSAHPYHWQLIGKASPEVELGYGKTAALTGTSATPHPAIIYPVGGTVFGMPVARILNADAGSFTLTGQDATLLVGTIVAADQASFTLTGQDASFAITIPIVAEQASFALTGQDVAFLHERIMAAAQASFTLTGFDASFVRVHRLIAAQASFALTGQDAIFRTARGIMAQQAAFALSGRSARLRSSATPDAPLTVTLR